MKTTILSLFLLLILTGCSEEEGELISSDLPVIEAYLKSGTSPIVDIHRQIGLSETSYATTSIDDLEVQLIVNGNAFQLVQDENSNYVNSDIVLQSEDVVEIKFTYLGKEVYALTEIPLSPLNVDISETTMEIPKIDMSSGTMGSLPEFPDPIEISWSNDQGNYFLLVVKNIELDPEPVIEFEEGEEAPDFVFRNEPTTANFYELQSQQFQYYGTHEVVIYSIQPDYAALYSDNSSTSQNLSSPNTGIQNGLGIFTGINADTLQIEIVED